MHHTECRCCRRRRYRRRRNQERWNRIISYMIGRRFGWIGALHTLNKYFILWCMSHVVCRTSQAHFNRSQWLHRPPMLNTFYHMNGFIQNSFSPNEIVGNMNPMRWLICNWYMCVMLFIRQPTTSLDLIHRQWVICHWYAFEWVFVDVLVALNPTRFGKNLIWTTTTQKDTSPWNRLIEPTFRIHIQIICPWMTPLPMPMLAIEVRERIRNGSFDSVGWCHN